MGCIIRSVFVLPLFIEGVGVAQTEKVAGSECVWVQTYSVHYTQGREQQQQVFSVARSCTPTVARYCPESCLQYELSLCPRGGA